MGLLYEELSYKLRAFAIEVRKNFGPGHKESIYQKAYDEELSQRGISFKQEEAIKIFSPKTGKLMGTYRPDFIVDQKVIIELKAVEQISKYEVNKLYTYLRNSEFELGFLINFGGNELYIKRVIYTNDKKPWYKLRVNPRSALSVNLCQYQCQSVLKGKVWKFGENINTDVIYPGTYLTITTNTAEMAKHCFERVYPDFIKKANPGDIIVAGKFFGCGSSREQAVTCLKAFGIQAIIAESFARIYYRNAINLGMPILIAPGITGKVNEGDIIAIELEKGIIKNETTGTQIQAQKLPQFIIELVQDGGLIPHLKKQLQKKE